MMQRRQFLGVAGRGAAGLLAAPTLLGSYGASAAKKLNAIGLQLYTVRNEMEKDFEGSLKKVADLGYKEVEFAGYYKRSPKDVKAILDRYGLVSPSAHVPLAAVNTQIDATIEGAKILGQKFLICPYLVDKDRKTIDDYKRHAESFNKAGEACKKAGIQFGYHNHDFEFQKIGDDMPFDLLLAQTDKNLVKIELDLYWITYAKQDPLAYIAKDPGRFVLLHVKDLDKTPKRGITEVGHGVIDFKTIFAKAGDEVKHYFVEQDTCPGSPFDSIKTSIDYLKPLEF
jgi:sugar phosphate isomerase/epimerase